MRKWKVRVQLCWSFLSVGAAASLWGKYGCLLERNLTVTSLAY